MAHRSSMQQSHAALARTLAAALPVFALACSGDVINVGDDAMDPMTDGACPAAGNIVIMNQAELDALEGCTAIEGDLQIVPFAHADLRPLHALRSVSGWLNFRVPNDIVDGATRSRLAALNREGWLALDGLEALESVGRLYIEGLASPSLVPLSNLRVITTGELTMTSCGGLRDLHGLEGLAGVNLLQLFCDELESIAALRLAREMIGLQIQGAKNLSDLGSPEVTTVFYNLVLGGTALRNLDALAKVSSVFGAVVIDNNPDLTSVDGLNQLERVGSLNLHGNPQLSRLPAFDVLSSLDALRIDENAQLSELSAFSGLPREDDFYPEPSEYWDERAILARRPDIIAISDNPELRQIAIPVGWDSGAHVSVLRNATLEHLSLGQLARVDFLEIEANPLLSSVELAALTRVDSLRLRDNPLLAPAAFDAVQTFERDMAGNAGDP
jgi:hypothetical protein